jgi:hypothetical protein
MAAVAFLPGRTVGHLPKFFELAKQPAYVGRLRCGPAAARSVSSSLARAVSPL